MKKILIPFFLLLTTVLQAQLNNSWIDYTKTYYKFRIGTTGLYRINQSALLSAGLGGASAEQFQLWRNGQQVPIFTSVASGSFGSNDYIEFLGKANDGKPDKNLYYDTSYQLNDDFSLFTDTAAYFLTVNAASSNLRYTNASNIIPTNPPAPDAYFMRRVENPYNAQINRGFAVNVGEAVYSASYDKGEGWTSNGIGTGSNFDLMQQFNNLNVYVAGPANSVSAYISAFGNISANNDIRSFRLKLFNTVLLDTVINGYNIIKRSITNQPLSILTNNSTDFATLYMGIHNSNDSANDQAVVATVTLTYPSKFNFNNQKNFYFELAASATGNYLVINNFNNNGITPMLYDINNGNRYAGDISTAGVVKFLLPGSTDDVRKFMLVSEDASNITAINTLSSQKFIDYAGLRDNQGDYIIISNPSLYNDGNGNNNVEAYRAYRASGNGGSYNAKIVSINELTDQFGFGIKKHPAAIRDFIISTQSWSVKPKYIFIIGRGVSSLEYRQNESDPTIELQDPVQTFGWPASDILLSCREGQVVPIVPIGRLSVVNGAEIKNYLDKMEEFEAAQASTTQTVAAKSWMKNFIHVAGGASLDETTQFVSFLNGYARIAEDTLLGATVSTFAKSSTSYIEQLSGSQIQGLINGGTNFIGYFGHSAANTLEFNLGDPLDYQNQGKYPFFNVSGCAAGDMFSYYPPRITQGVLSITEDWVLAHERGSIGFLADTHLGITNFLDTYNRQFYTEFSNTMYGNTVGNQMQKINDTLGGTLTRLNNNGGVYMRMHLEELNLDGDPALKLNSFALPDYVVEPQLIKVSPSIISVADSNFTVSVSMMNIGRAIGDSMRVIIERQLPNDSIKILYDKVIPTIKYLDSLNFLIPINAATDAGDNKIIVKLNTDGRIIELSSLNNTATVDFTIYNDELNPVYPYNYSIINQPAITYSASTANAIGSASRQYQMEVDTTALFNSPFIKRYSLTGPSGLIQFTPTDIQYADGTVYYWRTAITPLSSASPTIWNNFSFVYLINGGTGFNQSHYYQHLNSSYSNISLNANRVFQFNKVPRNLVIATGVYPSAFNADQLYENLDAVQLDQYGCVYNSLQVMVYDSSTFTPLQNYVVNGSGRFGSAKMDCMPGEATRNFFEFPYGDATYRKNFINFLDSIPNGMYVSITNLGVASNSNGITVNTSFINDWMSDPGYSLYNTLKSIGFTKIDSFTHNLPFIFFYQKGINSFAKQQIMGSSESQLIADTIPVVTSFVSGTISSPLFGPAKKWNFLHWNSNSVDPKIADSVHIQVYGVQADGSTQNLLATVSPATDTSLAFINAATYPYIKLVMQNKDSVYATPSQLNYWRINADYVPEGAVAPNILYTMKDTLSQGEKIVFEMAFKNISQVAFDSLLIRFVITDASNNRNTIQIPKGKALISGDTLIVKDTIDTKNFPGNNTLYVMVNPDRNQPEQYLSNNSIYQNFYVIPDKYNPTLDVTFDGVHILNKDIVSSKPHITIKMQDDSKFLSLNDTSLIKVQVYFPDPSLSGPGTLITYHFGDSMQFIPANLATGQNTATINLIGNFPIDGQYQLIVSGKDVESNPTGKIEYRVAFNVINKTMISNLFNYPNPFTTSTAFVFTLTGSTLPQNMRIQILTITGKVVKEITQNELGSLHLGDNVTEYKWNGTDMFGQKLANGVYLYRVLTNLNGKSIEKYNGTNANGEVISDGLKNTDQYFTKGYGKMYLMR